MPDPPCGGRVPARRRRSRGAGTFDRRSVPRAPIKPEHRTNSATVERGAGPVELAFNRSDAGTTLFLGASASRRYAREARDKDAGETPAPPQGGCVSIAIIRTAGGSTTPLTRSHHSCNLHAISDELPRAAQRDYPANGDDGTLSHRIPCMALRCP